MKNFHYFLILALGLFSGFFSGHLVGLDGWRIGAVFIHQGLFFAIAACLCFTVIFRQNSWTGYAGWALICIVAYNLAYWATFFLYAFTSGSGSSSSSPLVGPYLSFFFGGFLGAMVTAAGLKWCLVKISGKEILLLGLWGGILGLSALMPGLGQPGSEGNYPALFLIWQPAMLFLIMQISARYFNPTNQLEPKLIQ